MKNISNTQAEPHIGAETQTGTEPDIEAETHSSSHAPSINSAHQSGVQRNGGQKNGGKHGGGQKNGRGQKHGGGQVQSLNRAISIMRFIAAKPQGVRLSDIANGLGLAPSTVHRLLSSLAHEKFVRTDATTGHWHIGIDAFTIGNGFIQSKNVLLFAQTRLRDLVRNYSETASIYLENEGEMVCMHQYECHNMIRAITRVGGRVKMHNSGAGKAVLAYWENEEIEAIVRIHGLRQNTEKTISSLSSLKSDLQQVRKLGYAVDYEEAALGVCCIAAPIFNHQAKPIAAVSVSGPLTRINKVKFSEIAIGVKEAANQLSKEVGAHLVGFGN